MTSYKEILDKITFSFSTLHQYEQCPYAFYNRKIDGTELNEGNFYSDAGGYMHDIQAQIFANQLNLDDALNYYIENYDNNVCYTAKQSTMDKKYEQGADYLAALDLSELDNYEILGVEKEVHFELQGYKFIGFIDLLLQNKISGEIILVDHKSSDHFMKKDGKPLKNQLSNFEAYSKQMYLYSYPIYQEYGKYPSRIVWNHFYEQTITNIPFVKENYDKTLNWAVDIIHKIYQDEEFAAHLNYMMCHVLCGYRNSCEYVKGEE